MPNNNLRYAIWTAVSTKRQAEDDKESLREQLHQCRDYALAREWQESAGPYIVPGASRTKWVNLSDAERAIPPLRAMLEAAKRREFDILICYHLNRFRDLLDPVFRSLGVYGVQLFSLSQPVEPVASQLYNYETSDTMRIIVTMTQMTSQAETSDIRKRYNIGMPGRVINRGLPATAPPFGYIKSPDKKNPPTLDPALAEIVITMKDMYLADTTLRQIARWLDDNHIPPPRSASWYPETVRQILINPFYAGKVRWGKTRIIRDLRAGTRIRDRHPNPEQIATVPGKHTPLWDEATHQELVQQMSKRAISTVGQKKNQFSGLLHCSKCHATLWRQGNGPRGADRLIWRCSKVIGHVDIPHHQALSLISHELHQALKEQKETGSTHRQPADPLQVDKDIMDLKTQRKRMEKAYQAGAISLESLMESTKGIDDQLRKQERSQQDARLAQQQQAESLALQIDLAKVIQHIPDWMQSEDAPVVNRTLHKLLEHIIITPDFKIELVFK